MKTLHRFLFVMALFSAMATAVPAQAQPEQDTYAIRELEITLEESMRPVRARAEAVERATREGFEKLLVRLTPQNVTDQHPDIIARADMNRVLDSFNLLSEETDPDYTAVFNLRYNRDYVRNLLSRLSVPFSEVGAGPVLLLPVLDLSQRQLLWEETNPWRAKLEEAAKDAGLVQFVLPVGDPQEIMMLTPEMVAFGAGDMIMSVAENYNAEAAVVARFQMGMAPGGGREALLDLTWYGEQGVPPKYLQIPLESNQGLDAAMAAVAEQAINTVEGAWRQLYMVDFDRPGQTLVHFAADGAADLQRVRENLNQIPIVDSVLLRAVSSRNAVLQVNYFGTEEKLKTLAAERQIDIVPWNQKLVIALDNHEANTAAYGVRAVLRDAPMDQAMEREGFQPADMSEFDQYDFGEQAPESRGGGLYDRR